MVKPCRVASGCSPSPSVCPCGDRGGRTSPVSLADGRATVVARNATLRQVLAEWARVGGTRIVNLERRAGAPDSFELRKRARSQGARDAAPLGGRLHRTPRAAAPRAWRDPIAATAS